MVSYFPPSLLLSLPVAICSAQAVVDAFAPAAASSARRPPTNAGRRTRPPASASARTPEGTASTGPAAGDAAPPASSDRYRGAAVLIDVENVRGATDFALDHASLLAGLAAWTAPGRTVVAVVDHGAAPTAHLLPSRLRGGGARGAAASFCVTFAGPDATADDVVARDARWLLYAPGSAARRVAVVTSDRELMARCRSAARSDVGGSAFRGMLRKFAAEGGYEYGRVLDAAMRKYSDGSDGPGSSGSGGGLSVASNSILRRLSGHGCDGVHFRKGGKTRKRGKRSGREKSRSARARQQSLQPQQHRQQLPEERAGGRNRLDGVANIVGTDATRRATAETSAQRGTVPRVEIVAPHRFLEDLEEASRERRELRPFEEGSDAAVAGWVERQGTFRRRPGARVAEETEDRIGLAEGLRRQLMLADSSNEPRTEENALADGADGCKLSLLEVYSEYVNCLCNGKAVKKLR